MISHLWDTSSHVDNCTQQNGANCGFLVQATVKIHLTTAFLCCPLFMQHTHHKKQKVTDVLYCCTVLVTQHKFIEMGDGGEEREVQLNSSPQKKKIPESYKLAAIRILLCPNTRNQAKSRKKLDINMVLSLGGEFAGTLFEPICLDWPTNGALPHSFGRGIECQPHCPKLSLEEDCRTCTQIIVQEDGRF